MKYIRIFLIITLVFSITACGKKDENKGDGLRFVRYQKIEANGVAASRTFSAVIQSQSEAKLSFRVSGTIKKIFVKVGDRVNQGQQIAELEEGVYALQVQQAEAGLRNSTAQSENAKKMFDRITKLREKKSVSESEYDSMRTMYEASQAGLSAGEKQLEMAKLQLSYTKLFSNVSGFVAYKNGEEGENTGAGMPLLIINSESSPEAKFAIPEGLISKIKKGEEVDITVDSDKSLAYKGHIKEVGVSTIASLPTTFPVIASIDMKKEAPKLLSGMTASVTIKMPSTGDAGRIIAPAYAVGEDKAGSFVFVVKPEEKGTGTVSRRTVKRGVLSNAGIEILEGLSAGELLVTAGISFIENGMKVKLGE